MGRTARCAFIPRATLPDRQRFHSYPIITISCGAIVIEFLITLRDPLRAFSFSFFSCFSCWLALFLLLPLLETGSTKIGSNRDAREEGREKERERVRGVVRSENNSKRRRGCGMKRKLSSFTFARQFYREYIRVDIQRRGFARLL